MAPMPIPCSSRKIITCPSRPGAPAIIRSWLRILVINRTIMKRRKFLDQIAKAGLMGVMPLAPTNYKRADQQDTLSFTLLTEPYLQHATPTAISVMWVTSINGVGWIELADGQAIRKVVNAEHGLNRANERVMKVRIE